MADKTPKALEGASGLSREIAQKFEELLTQTNDVIATEIEKLYSTVVGESLSILGAMLFCWIVWQAYNAFFGQGDLNNAAKTGMKFINRGTVLYPAPVLATPSTAA